MERNQEMYNNAEVVRRYKSELKLQPAEKTIVDLLQPKLKESRVLDIGVGTGRTTIHLAPICKSYVGVDYAAGMIDYCKETFHFNNASFDVCDARDMHQFKNEEFDVVIFSFNGIDCVPYEDRDKVLKEIHRILKPGGHFIFSTHNARNLEKKYSIILPRNPLNYFKEKARVAKVKQHNGAMQQFKDKKYFTFFDGAENDWGMPFIYILPEFQMEILKSHNFSQFRFFNRTTGKEMTAAEFPTYKEAWVYYWCVKN